MLDRDGPIPLYKQIAEVIRERILNGDIIAGEAVPSEAELEGEYGVARTTARRVARELREQGLVHTIHGEGTFAGEPDAPRTPRRTPRYLRIAEEVAERIRRGDFPPNRAIPSEKALMAQYGVAKATVRNAVAHLREQGWVFTVSHRGTYVTPEEKRPGTAGG